MANNGTKPQHPLTLPRKIRTFLNIFDIALELIWFKYTKNTENQYVALIYKELRYFIP